MPKPPTRFMLRVFWVLLSAGIGAGVTLLLVGFWALPAWVGGIIGCGVAVAAGAAGLANPYAVALPYRAWNWLAARLAAMLAWYVTAVCFLTVMLLAATSARHGDFVRIPATSAWVARRPHPGPSYRLRHDEFPVRSHRHAWLATVREWASRSGNGWVLGFLPFLYLLRILDAEDASSAPSSEIYTLY